MTDGWRNRRVLVTGGASFIGSHLVDALCTRGAVVRVVDDLSSGTRDHIAGHLAEGMVEFVHDDLREPGVARAAAADIEVLFHLAADHGGRGYVDLHQAGPATNLLLDGLVFREALRAGVGKIVYASSGCVYPNYLQTDTAQLLYLSEDCVAPPYDADNLYGWAKLMAELTLQAYAAEHGVRAVSCRYFTVFGPRAKENHAVLAMIARAFLRQDPYQVWGTGEQIRGWTYVDDIVSGTILAAERIDDGSAVNLGAMERVRVRDAAEMICRLFGYRPSFEMLPDMPSGPLNRVADSTRARQLLGWEPSVTFAEGVRRTMEWYVATHDADAVRQTLAGGGLVARNLSASRR